MSPVVSYLLSSFVIHISIGNRHIGASYYKIARKGHGRGKEKVLSSALSIIVRRNIAASSHSNNNLTLSDHHRHCQFHPRHHHLHLHHYRTQICAPWCTRGCINGECTAPETCTCKPSFRYSSSIMIIGVSFTIITIIISITIIICWYSSILKVKILILILIENLQWREV